MNMQNINHKIVKQHGFNLLEVMVSLLIFSLGLLGLAGLQQVGLTQNNTAMQRTIAMNHAYDILDRMRNNKLINYTAAAAAAAPNCITAPCTAIQTANYDIYEWDLALTNSLANGKGFITGGINGYTISVGWDESRTGSIPTSCNPPAPADVKCISLQGRP